MAKKYLRIIKIAGWVLLKNPKLFLKRVFLILKSSVFPLKDYPRQKNINGVVFSLDFDDCGSLKKMIYYDMYEMGLVDALHRFLCPGDAFIDAGANIGYISAVAASLVGKNGQVHSFEPVPEFFLRLQNLALANKEYHIIANRLALSNKNGMEKIYLSDYSNIGANTIIPSLLENGKSRGSVSVETLQLDEYIEKNSIKDIKAIKIDTEGFEYPVLLGMENFLNKCCVQKLFAPPVIICEICPPAYAPLGYKLEDIFNYMNRFGYRPFGILDCKEKLDIKKIGREATINIIFKNNAEVSKQ